MRKIDDVRHWLTAEVTGEERDAIEQRANPPGGGLAALNAIGITGPKMRAAIGAIQHISVRRDADVVEHGRILRESSVECGFPEVAGAALLARVPPQPTETLPSGAGASFGRPRSARGNVYGSPR